MRIWKLETLPLLATFQALMDHGGVTEAAEKLGLTQSAVSKHLTKLRDAYDDPLFIRTPEGMRPTPRATWMSAHVSTILTEAEALARARPFQPHDLDGVITVSTTDEVSDALIAKLLPRLALEAPDARLTFVPLATDYSLRDLEAGQIDLVISVNWHAPDALKQSRLFNDRFACVMGAEHPLADREMTIEAFAATEHVLVAPLGMQAGLIDETLARHDLKRRTRLSVPIFRQLAPSVLKDRFIATLPARIAQRLERDFSGKLVVHPLPFDTPEIAYFSMWHTRFDKDPRHIWLRQIVRDALR